MKKLTLHEFRLLVRKLVNEADHVDPTARGWDSGLDEAEENGVPDSPRLGGLGESEEEHEGDPRWEKHADPTGRSWDTGLDD